MLSLDLFNSKFEKHLAEGTVTPVAEQEQDIPSEPIPNNINKFNTPENRALVKRIWAQISQHAIEDTAGWLTLEWPNQPAVTLSRNQVWTVVNKIAKMPNTQRNAWALSTMGDRNSFLTWVNGLKIIPRPVPKKEIPKGQQKLDLKERDQKKSSEELKFKNTRLDRLKTQARARYPSAGSDMEALAADFVDQQDQDQQELDRVKSVNSRQDELLKQITALNRSQDQEIENLSGAEQSLQQNITQLKSANAELAKKLANMTARRSAEQPAPVATAAATPVPQPAVGVSVATDKVPAASVAPTPPVDTRARQYARALRRQVGQIQSQLQQQRQTPISTATQATVGGQDADVMPAAGKDDYENDVIDLKGVDDVLSQFRRPPTKQAGKKKSKKKEPEFSLTEEPVRSIPGKMVIQGYTVEYDPVQRIVTVSRGGKVVGRAKNNSGSYNNYYVVASRIIDNSEEDKYPDDLEVRSVERPFGESADELTAQDILFRTAAKAMYDANQQGVDLDYEEAIKIASKLMRIPYAPSMLPALQSQLADVEKKIATMKAVRRAQRQREREKVTHQTTDDEERRRQEFMKTYGNALQRRLQTRQTESEEKKQGPSKAYQEGGREAYYGRPKNNPYEKGTKEYQDYNRGYSDFEDNGKFTEALDRSGQKMYQQEEVYMLTHDGKEIAFYRLKDLKRAEQDAQDMQKKLGGEVHIRKVMREAEQPPKDDDIMGKLFKDFGEIFGKQPSPQPKPQEKEKKDVKEGDVVKIDFRQGADAEAVRAFKEKRADYFDKIAKADPATAQRLRAELQDLEDAARRRGLIREGRAGYGPLLNQKHWEEVEQHLFKIINDRNVDDQTRAEAKQRWLDKQREAKLKGFRE